MMPVISPVEQVGRNTLIPAMRRELTEAGMPEPEFRDERGTFVACFRKAVSPSKAVSVTSDDSETTEEKLLRFCAVPRTRQEIAAFLGIKSVPYTVTTYVTPLVERGLIALSLPEKPRSPKQRYTAKQS